MMPQGKTDCQRIKCSLTTIFYTK